MASQAVENPKPKKKITLNAFVLIFCVIILCAIASYFVTPGVFDREVRNGQTVIVPDSYHTIEKTNLNPFAIMQAIPNGLIGSANVVFLILLVGGAIEVYNKSGAINMAVSRMVHKLNGKGRAFILAIIMLIFAVLGAFLGWIEAAIPFVPLVIPIVLALGYDSMTAVGTCILGLMTGFAVGPTNMYTVGIAHTIAEMPMFSGLGLRMIAFVVFIAVALAYLLIYAERVRKNPSKSLTAGIDVSDITYDFSQDKDKKMSVQQTVSLLVLVATFGVVIYGMMNWNWNINDVSAAFLLSGIVAGVINRMSFGTIADAVVAGAKGSIGGALIVGTARGVQWILEQGGIIDPLINGLSSLLKGLPPIGSAIGIVLVVSLLNGLVASGSGKAVALMPIMIPLADLIGLSRQTTILAYQFGDGITNMFWFSYGTLLFFLSYGKVPINKWYRFYIPLMLIFFLMAVGFLGVAVGIGY